MKNGSNLETMVCYFKPWCFFLLYLFEGIFSLMRKMVLKKCLHFFWSSGYSLSDQIYFYYFFLDILWFFTRICLRKTQNMFSALKPKPWSSTLELLLRWKNNEILEHKPSHRFSTPSYLTTSESTFKFLLAMSAATDLSTTAFFIFHCSNNSPAAELDNVTQFRFHSGHL